MNKKDLGVVFGLFAAIALLIIFGGGFTSLKSISPVGEATQSAKTRNSSIDIMINSFVLKSEVADNPNERKVGLSKFDSIPQNSAMLFVFEKEDKYAIWMKNMKFSIDIIWINKDKKIVMIAKNVLPEPGKKDGNLTVYKPDSSALYILEVNAGISDLNNLKVGDKVLFQL